MKIQVVKQELLKIFVLALEATEKENINSYYSYFIFIAKNNKLTVKSANRQISFEQYLHSNEMTKLEIIKEGEFLLPGQKIFNIINSLHDGLISFESNEKNLKVIESGDKKSNIEFNLRLKDINDFPSEIHDLASSVSCEISVDELLKLINNTAFAASSNTKSASLFLTGVFFDINDDILTAVATDRNRISICSTPVKEISKLKEVSENHIIIPQKAALYLKKIISTNLAISAIIGLNKDKIIFKFSDITISINLISGEYYDYKRLIPQNDRNRIIVNTSQLKEAVSRVIVATDNLKDKSVQMSIKDNSQLSISAEEKDKSSAEETIPIQLQGNTNTFLIKSQFILDPLNIIASEDVHIEYGDTPRDLIKIVSSDERDTAIHIAAQLIQ